MESRDATYSSNFTVNGTLTNTGSFEVNNGSGGTRTFGGSIVNQGTLTLSGGPTLTMTNATLQNAAGGTLRGVGTLSLTNTPLTNGGTIAPGVNSAATLTTSNFTQSAAGAASIDVDSAAVDRVAVSGAAVLDGTLNLSRLNGFIPPIGAAFDILTFTSRTGTFSAVNGASIGNGTKFQVNYSTTKVTLTVVPE